MISAAALVLTETCCRHRWTRWPLACDNLSAMMRLLACSLCVFLATVALAEDELPKDPETSFDVEPPLLIQEQPNQRGLRAESESVSERESDPERTEVALEKARRRVNAFSAAA